MRPVYIRGRCLLPLQCEWLQHLLEAAFIWGLTLLEEIRWLLWAHCCRGNFRKGNEIYKHIWNTLILTFFTICPLQGVENRSVSEFSQLDTQAALYGSPHMLVRPSYVNESGSSLFRHAAPASDSTNDSKMGVLNRKMRWRSFHVADLLGFLIL